MHEPQPIKRLAHIPAIPLIAAWLVPGLGHLLVGQYKRGLILAFTIIALFTAGLFIGSLSVVNREQQPLWFAGQIFIGPTALVLDNYNQKNIALHPEDLLDDPQHTLVVPSIARQHEMGTLYCSLAGVLNLLIILDLIGRITEQSNVPEHLQGQLVTRDN